MKNNYQLIIASIAAMLFFAGSASATFADTSSSLMGTVRLGGNASADSGVGVGTRVDANAGANLRAEIVSRAKDRADQEITRRISALNVLNARVNAMARVSAGEKSGLLGTLGTQITAMQNLQVKIDADANGNSTSSLKDDIQSITRSYRIFMLIVPQAALTAAADRAMTIASTTGALAVKLQARIAAAQASGTDMTASVSALADLNLKIADASVQAQAALNVIAGLQPDNGDQAVMQSNTAALKDARAKIKTAQQDLTAARKDAGNIVKALTTKP